jgi:dimethylhistidine N-methyltransferase
MSATALVDCAPQSTQIEDEVIAGLSCARKTLPCKLFYDERGSRLFELICRQPEYYPTRTELRIMRSDASAMAERIGPNALLVELGSGAGIKTRVLLDHLESPAAYVPIDISREMLIRTAEAVNADYPDVEVLPVCADYTADYTLPKPSTGEARAVFYYPGSTIGNFEPDSAVEFMADMRAKMGDGGGLLIGVDLRKDPDVIEAAYDDEAGVTAAFNKNILARLNRELCADFDVEGFVHRAFFNRRESRIEMHLESLRAQRVTVAGCVFAFRAGETICTEYSYKYTLPAFESLAREAGFAVDTVWTDPHALFSVQYLSAA